jgi:hypothetical protein
MLSYTFSPALLLHGSQPLKDELFLYMVGLALLGASLFLPRLIDGAKSAIWLRSALIGLAAVGAAVYNIAGIRIYYALILWAALATVLVVGGFRQPVGRVLKYSGAALAALAVLWITYSTGAGAASYTQLITPKTIWRNGFIALPSFISSIIRNARGGFEVNPGGTNLVPMASTPAPTTLDAPLALGPSTTSRRIAFGVAALTIPISLMRALGLVNFAGGRGLLLIADIDTIFLELTMVAGLALVATHFRDVKRNWPFALTAVLVGGVTAVLLAYVVTNYGALFRLRLLAAMPIWLLPLATTDDDLVDRATRSDDTTGPVVSLFSIR